MNLRLSGPSGTFPDRPLAGLYLVFLFFTLGTDVLSEHHVPPQGVAMMKGAGFMEPNKLAVNEGTPLWPPNGKGTGDLPPIEVKIDPGYYELYPRPVVDLVALDVIQGEWLRGLVAKLVTQGMPREAAKEIIYPKAPGSPFRDVYDRSRSLTTIVKMGGGGFKWTKDFERFESSLSLMQALLGLSTTNGGGPGIMMLTSAALVNALSLLQNREYSRLTQSELIQVLLQIGVESPNLLGKKEFRVWAIDSLKTRTAMLMSLGIPLSVVFYPGGFGTGEELLRTLVDDQLYGQIVTAQLRRIPLFLIDFDASSNNHGRHHSRWVNGLREVAKRMRLWGCIGSSTLRERMHIIRVEDPDSPEKVIRALDKEAQRPDMLGFSLLEKWESKNNANFFTTAKELLPEVAAFSLPKPPKGKQLAE